MKLRSQRRRWERAEPDVVSNVDGLRDFYRSTGVVCSGCYGKVYLHFLGNCTLAKHNLSKAILPPTLRPLTDSVNSKIVFKPHFDERQHYLYNLGQRSKNRMHL